MRMTNKWGHPKCSEPDCENAIYSDGLCYNHGSPGYVTQAQRDAAGRRVDSEDAKALSELAHKLKHFDGLRAALAEIASERMDRLADAQAIAKAAIDKAVS